MIDFDAEEEDEGGNPVHVPDHPAVGAVWLARMAAALEAYEAAEACDRGQVTAFKALRQQFPELEFPLRAEPRDTLVDIIARSWSADPLALGGAITQFVTANALNLEFAALQTVLSVLADAGVVLSEGDLFATQSLLGNWPGEASIDDGVRSLILLTQPGNWRAIVSLIERVAADGRPHPRLLQAGLESVAKYAPSQLGAALVRLRDHLELLSPAALSRIVDRLAANATPYIFALALIELDPLRSPKLLAAAFDEQEARFRFVYDAVDVEDETVARIQDGSDFLPLSDDRIDKDLQVWIALANTAIGMARGKLSLRVFVSHIVGTDMPSNRETRIDHCFAALVGVGR